MYYWLVFYVNVNEDFIIKMVIFLLSLIEVLILIMIFILLDFYV